jgi:hypothetical protein
MQAEYRTLLRPAQSLLEFLTGMHPQHMLLRVRPTDAPAARKTGPAVPFVPDTFLLPLNPLQIY